MIWRSNGLRETSSILVLWHVRLSSRVFRDSIEIQSDYFQAHRNLITSKCTWIKTYVQMFKRMNGGRRFFFYISAPFLHLFGAWEEGGGSLNLKTLQTPAPGTQNSWCDTVYLRLEAECGPQSQSAPMSEEWVGCYFDGVSLSHR